VVREIVRGRTGDARWQVVIDRPGTIDAMELNVEHAGGDGEELRRALVKDVKGAIGLTCTVTTVAPGTLAEDAPAIVDRRDFR
jgi:hypothetical protein